MKRFLLAVAGLAVLFAVGGCSTKMKDDPDQWINVCKDRARWEVKQGNLERGTPEYKDYIRKCMAKQGHVK